MTYIERVSISEFDNGALANLKSTSEGHLEVAVHGPRLPFGSMDVAELTPIVQQDAVYGLSSELIQTSGNGVVSGSGNLFHVATANTTAGSFASLQSRKRLRYRPGQGVVTRYTALFTSGVANNVQVAGAGTSEAGYYFGYNSGSFGILHVTNGVREIQSITISGTSTAPRNVTVTLAGTAHTVAITAGSATLVAYQLSKFNYTGWKAEQRGTTVVFLANSAGNQSGVFSLVDGLGEVSGTFTETLTGVASTDTWTPQASWNGDKLDGTGASNAVLDPTKGNVYQIDVQYLGFGSVAFKTEIGSSGNNADFVTVHTLRFPNSRTTPTISQPSFPFTMSTYNSGVASVTSSVKSGSFAGFTAGKKVYNGPRASFIGSVTSSLTDFVPIVTVRNSLIYNSRANQSVAYLLSVSGACKSTNGLTTFYLIRNATLSTGTPSFTAQGTGSVFYYDTGATVTTFSNTDLVWSATVGETGQFTFSFTDDIDLQPGETLTLAVKSVTQTAVCVGQMNFREDQ